MGKAFPFRGQLSPIHGNSNALAAAGLDWNVEAQPVKVSGITVPGYQAIVRGDTGQVLSITSERFKPHQNAAILQNFQRLADVGNAELLYAGLLGNRVVAIARLEGEFEITGRQIVQRGIAALDITRLYVIISGGHEPATPNKLTGMAYRLVCLNGNYFAQKAMNSFTITHRSELDDNALARAFSAYGRIRDEFSAFGQQQGRLSRMAISSVHQFRLYVAELIKPGFAARLGASMTNTVCKLWRGVACEREPILQLNSALKASFEEPGFKLQGKRLIEAIDQQPGRPEDSLYAAYNGITNYVDHTRGRSDATGVESSLFGDGAQLKQRALQTALYFADEIEKKN